MPELDILRLWRVVPNSGRQVALALVSQSLLWHELGLACQSFSHFSSTLLFCCCGNILVAFPSKLCRLVGGYFLVKI